MLPMPEIKNSDFDTLFQEAVKKIKKIYPDWTNINYSDPGIMILEALAMLQSMQHAYMDEVSDKTYENLLKLIGIRLDKMEPAKSEVVVDNVLTQLTLPEGTKFKAGEYIFESIESNTLVNFDCLSISTAENDKITNSINTDRLTGELFYFPFGKEIKENTQFYLCFDGKFFPEKSYSINLQINNELGIQRNPIIDEKSFVDISKVKWEYYGEKNGEIGWHVINITKDSTYNLIQSGDIEFSIEGFMQSIVIKDINNRSLYYLRCTLIKDGYDIVPSLTNINMNSIKVIQKNTYCKEYKFSKKDLHNNTAVINHFLAIHGEYIVMVKSNNLWKSIHDTSVKYTFEKDIYNGQAKFLFENVHEINPEGDFVKIVFFTEEFNNYIIPGGSDGISSLILSIGLENILYNDFELMVGKSESGELPLYEEWHKTSNIRGCTKYEEVYELDEVEGTIIFGDNTNGTIPPKGDFNILISSLSTTTGVKGNIREDSINKILGSNYEDYTVINKKPAFGGKNRETIKDGKIKIFKRINKSNQAVIGSDYEEIVRNTQGVIIKNVKALPLYNKDLRSLEHNTITVIVDLYRNKQGKLLSEEFIDNIKRNLDKHRLITTKVLITTPTYVGIEIFGEIIVKENYPMAYNTIVDRVVTLINDRYGSLLGETVRYGEIYSELDMLECVAYVKNLSIHSKDVETKKLANGDLEICPTGRIYLSECNINITK